MALKTARLTNEITTLSEDELNKIKYIQQAVCSKVVKKEHQDKIMREIKMRNTLYDNAWKEGKVEGIEKGIEITENKIKTLIQNKTLPPNTIELIHNE